MSNSTHIRSNLNPRGTILLLLRQQTGLWNRKNARNLRRNQRGRKCLPEKGIQDTGNLRNSRRHANRTFTATTRLDKREANPKSKLSARILLWRFLLGAGWLLRNGHRHQSNRESSLRSTRRLEQGIPNRIPRRRSNGAGSGRVLPDRKSTRLNSSHGYIS